MSSIYWLLDSWTKSWLKLSIEPRQQCETTSPKRLCFPFISTLHSEHLSRPENNSWRAWQKWKYWKCLCKMCPFVGSLTVGHNHDWILQSNHTNSARPPLSSWVCFLHSRNKVDIEVDQKIIAERECRKGKGFKCIWPFIKWSSSFIIGSLTVEPHQRCETYSARRVCFTFAWHSGHLSKPENNS